MRIGLWTLVTTAILSVVGAVTAFAFYSSVPIPDERNELGQTTIVYYDDGQTEMGKFTSEDRIVLKSEEIPDHVKEMFVAAEDTTFYENSGVSVVGIMRAAWGNFRKAVFKSGGATQGGSTITQQYVKVNYLTFEQTYTRKLNEIVIALKIEQQMTKDEILTGYLNSIYLGRGKTGIQAAAQSYFGVDAKDLTPSQAALLAGITPAANAWDPAKNPEKAQDRWQYTIDRAEEAGLISAAEKQGMTFPEIPKPKVEEQFRGPKGHLLQLVRNELSSKGDGTANALGVTDAQLDTGGLRITTTVNKQMMDDAIATINDPKVYPTNRPPGVHVGLVSIEPQTGEIKAMYGGPDYLERQVSSASYDVSQAGSTFKPFTMIGGLEQGISLDTIFDGSNGQTFPGFTDASGRAKPVNNYGNSDPGNVSLQDSLRRSYNTPFVKLNEMIGPEKTQDVGFRLGLRQSDGFGPHLGNTLGDHSVTTLELTRAYSTIANNGVRNDAHIVRQVEFPNGRVAKTNPNAARVVREDVIADATYAMSQVTKDGGTASKVRNYGFTRPAAGKTGTSTGNKSAWFVGFTPQLATGVSLYHLKETDGGKTQVAEVVVGGEAQTGGARPTAIWASYMKKAMKDMPVEKFPGKVGVGRAITVPGVNLNPTPKETETSTETSTETPTETATGTETLTPIDPTEPTLPGPPTTLPPFPTDLPTVTLPIDPPPGGGGPPTRPQRPTQGAAATP